MQMIMNMKAPLNVRNFKFKPPSGKWSTQYDRALKKYRFCEEENDESSTVCQSFSEKPRRKLSILVINT